MKKFDQWFMHAFYCDPVRLTEIVSILAMGGWSFLLWQSPHFLLRDGYAGMSALPAPLWAIVFSAVAMFNCFALIKATRFSRDIRFISMATASGLWTIIAVTFWQNPLISTAEITYSALAFACALSGIWIKWTQNSF